ncbi:hypothetical protein CLOLEP_03349 [[Clostridium] leptum DSM 753]|uniref:Uncharacterized protein n=1 Tax=[Clostridium] leptum DSM 753 TaxID=428125 RepID=A7VXM4_9FIRM|nr:hypothetical protein CLOLEP_03349 [[Clostridium] leptum DSM 753]
MSSYNLICMYYIITHVFCQQKNHIYINQIYFGHNIACFSASFQHQ